MNAKSRIPATIMAVLTRTRTMTRTGFLIAALCSIAVVGSVADQNENEAIPVAVYDTFALSPATPPPGYNVSFVGVFTAIIGTEVVRGRSRMDVNTLDEPGIARCKFTWVRADGRGKGTLVVKSVCVLADGHGTWHVEQGTGRFRNFKAIGTETFGPLPAGGPFTNYERFAGIGTDDEHGENDNH